MDSATARTGGAPAGAPTAPLPDGMPAGGGESVAERRARGEAFWAGAAPGWIRHADRQDRLGQPLGAVAMRWLAAQPGERVVDIGCGCGGTTAELAGAVGPTGSALGVDLSPAMAHAARERFPADRYPRLEFVAADIETVPALPGAPFDAAYSRMTLMLLADPVAGCATIRRALRRGGRLAATVFQGAASTPWLAAVLLGAAPHLGALPPLPIGDEPGPFAFADPERIRRVLAGAGFTDPEVTGDDVELRAPDEPDAVAEWLIEVGPAGAPYRAASGTARAAARAGAMALLSRFRTPGEGYRLPVGLWLVTARVPG